MGLIQDRRPRDWAYIASFNEKDLPSLQEMIKKINETHDTNLIQEFNKKCEQKAINPDQNISIEGMTFQDVSKSEDLAVNTGLQHCINLILNTLSTRWSHFGMGSTATSATVNDTALFVETIATRVPLVWAEAVGMRLFFGAISSQTDGIAPENTSEIGVYNGSAAGAILLNHSVFANRVITQQSVPDITQMKTSPIIVSAVIEFCPVV